MAKDQALSFRVNADTKVALERAAHDDERSVSWLVERILRQWLQAKGYLPEERSPPS